jgi:hypothetical protein
MRSLEINNTAIDLQAQDVPFNPGSSFVVINTSAETRTVQGATDSAFTTPVTVATLAAAGLANSVQTITPTLQYLRTSAASDPIWALGN